MQLRVALVVTLAFAALACVRAAADVPEMQFYTDAACSDMFFSMPTSHSLITGCKAPPDGLTFHGFDHAKYAATGIRASNSLFLSGCPDDDCGGICRLSFESVPECRTIASPLSVDGHDVVATRYQQLDDASWQLRYYDVPACDAEPVLTAEVATGGPMCMPWAWQYEGKSGSSIGDRHGALFQLWIYGNEAGHSCSASQTHGAWAMAEVPIGTCAASKWQYNDQALWVKMV